MCSRVYTSLRFFTGKRQLLDLWLILRAALRISPKFAEKRVASLNSLQFGELRDGMVLGHSVIS